MTARRVTLVGFDIGTTTSRAAFADAQIVKNARSGGREFGHVVQRPHTSSIMTPFSGEALDEDRLVSWMDDCFTEAHVRASDVFGGGGLLTGLAARASNAGAVAESLRARVANAVIATADDPKLEAWLAFQGSVGAISRAYPSRSILNLDIGGGTTNAACGRGGNVFWTEWSWVGARHIVVRPGTYVIERCSSVGQETLDRLSIRKMKGDELTPIEVDAIVQAWVGDLENMLQQAALPSGAQKPEVAFSGGVGELVYAVRMGKTVPGTTHWGDLGIDLARAICGLNIWGFGSPSAPFAPRSTLLTERIVVPTNMGRATLYGLVEHQTQVSGTTIFCPIRTSFRWETFRSSLPLMTASRTRSFAIG
jgi:ethanolamine utilization protein EutA